MNLWDPLHAIVSRGQPLSTPTLPQQEVNQSQPKIQQLYGGLLIVSAVVLIQNKSIINCVVKKLKEWAQPVPLGFPIIAIGLSKLAKTVNTSINVQ